MADYLQELNRIMAHLATLPEVVLTALAGDAEREEFLVLSHERSRFADADDWALGFDLVLEPAGKRGSLIERRGTLAAAPVTFLFGEPDWASADPVSDDTARMIRAGVFEIHDPHHVIQTLNERLHVQHASFADDSEIAKYADVASNFFELIGLGYVVVTNESVLSDICDATGTPIESVNARIREVYGVDVSDLKGGRIVAIFERIRQGEAYKEWRSSQA